MKLILGVFYTFSSKQNVNLLEHASEEDPAGPLQVLHGAVPVQDEGVHALPRRLEQRAPPGKVATPRPARREAEAA